MVQLGQQGLLSEEAEARLMDTLLSHEAATAARRAGLLQRVGAYSAAAGGAPTARAARQLLRWLEK